LIFLLVFVFIRISKEVGCLETIKYFLAMLGNGFFLLLLFLSKQISNKILLRVVKIPFSRKCYCMFSKMNGFNENLGSFFFFGVCLENSVYTIESALPHSCVKFILSALVFVLFIALCAILYCASLIFVNKYKKI
jgi:hypothetical protein